MTRLAFTTSGSSAERRGVTMTSRGWGIGRWIEVPQVRGARPLTAAAPSSARAEPATQKRGPRWIDAAALGAGASRKIRPGAHRALPAPQTRLGAGDAGDGRCSAHSQGRAHGRREGQREGKEADRDAQPVEGLQTGPSIADGNMSPKCRCNRAGGLERVEHRRSRASAARRPLKTAQPVPGDCGLSRSSRRGT